MNLLDEIKPEYITDKKGKKKSVIISLDKFEELIEDIEDLATMAERREYPTISHEEMIKYLKENYH